MTEAAAQHSAPATPAAGTGTILICCGEPSGDVYAAMVARALCAQAPAVTLVGVGGAQLRDSGVPLWADLAQLSVMGFAEVVRHLPRLARLRRHLAQRAEQSHVGLLLAVDYPGFNVALAGAMRERGIPTLHFIPPKTWSWGAWRLRELRRCVAACAVIFPFEADYYRGHGVTARFVGHPLLDLHHALLEQPSSARRGLLLCPGSRRQELLRIGPQVGEAAARLLDDGSVESVQVSLAAGADRSWLAPLLSRCPQATVVEGSLLARLREARAAIVTSGTATLEAALAQTPHAIVYRTSALTYALARAMATVEHIGIVNIVLARRAVPELLQSQLRAEALVSVMRPLLAASSPEVLAQRAAFVELRGKLRAGGAADAVARMALELLAAGPSL